MIQYGTLSSDHEIELDKAYDFKLELSKPKVNAISRSFITQLSLTMTESLDNC